MTYAEYAEHYPIRQNRNTGGYGFRRHAGGFDLTQCPHESKGNAEKARRRAWEEEEMLTVYDMGIYEDETDYEQPIAPSRIA